LLIERPIDRFIDMMDPKDPVIYGLFNEVEHAKPTNIVPAMVSPSEICGVGLQLTAMQSVICFKMAASPAPPSR
jgi:hypothetical protein